MDNLANCRSHTDVDMVYVDRRVVDIGAVSVDRRHILVDDIEPIGVLSQLGFKTEDVVPADLIKDHEGCPGEVYVQGKEMTKGGGGRYQKTVGW